MAKVIALGCLLSVSCSPLSKNSTSTDRLSAPALKSLFSDTVAIRLRNAEGDRTRWFYGPQSTLMFTNSLNAANWINCDECLHMGGVTLDLITERGIWMRLWTGTDKTDGILESSTMIVEGSSLEQLVLDGIKDERILVVDDGTSSSISTLLQVSVEWYGSMEASSWEPTLKSIRIESSGLERQIRDLWLLDVIARVHTVGWSSMPGGLDVILREVLDNHERYGIPEWLLELLCSIKK